MAEAGTSRPCLYICPVCQDLLKDPVTIPCGRSFCEVCINACWDQEVVKGVHSCPQCRETFTPRPNLHRSKKLTKIVEELKRTEVQAAHCYAGPGDVECDSCIGRKRKAIKFCQVCRVSYCEDHLKPHYQSPAFKKHELLEASAELQEKICSQHDKLNETYCRTDQSFNFYLCMMDEHKGHETGSTSLNELKEEQMKSQQRIQEKEKKVQELCVSPGCEDSPSIHRKIRVEEKCEKEFNKIHPRTAAVRMILPSEPKSREEFLQYFCYLTLDPNTAHRRLIITEKNRVVTHSKTEQQYCNHPERFHSYTQVLCKESVCGRCYWEVEWSSSVSISVSYKEINRKGQGYKCLFGYNNQSWSLQCSSSSVCYWNNNIKTELRGPASSRIGVYVDHSAGTLSFYSVSDTMRLLHRVHTTFTQPLYAGFRIWYNSAVRLCDPKLNVGKSVIGTL